MDAIRTWLITAPGWLLVAILAAAAIGCLCVTILAALVSFALTARHLAQRKDGPAPRRWGLADVLATTAPQEIDGSDCHD
jgi:hypothetical protein